MKVFLSALEASPEFYYINSKIDSYKYNLMSFYYIKKEEIFKEIIRKSELILIDSGAHSFQKGKKVDWVEYTKKYAEWIRQNDCDKILGYFEMDVDNIIGYENVLELRKILESVTDKIIPVWHKNRGIEEFKKMCKDYQGKIIAITGFKNEDIQDHQYMMFLKYAKKYNCKVHCLGMTRKKILDEVPFDFVDSSSWKQQAIYGRVGKNKVTKEYSKVNRKNVMLHCYLDGMEMQEKYYKKWQKIECR
jgi:hypothetical protein